MRNEPTLGLKFGVSSQTVSKWKNRDFATDVSSRPHRIDYALTDLQQALAISIRKSSWMSLDEVWEMLLVDSPNISRSSVYRCFKRENVHRVAEKDREKAKKFKEYEPGFLHIDVTYLPKFDGQKYYLYVAIDRATRLMYYAVYERKTAENTDDFMDKCFNFFPFKITHILTDNGLEFTNKLLISKKGASCKTDSKMDVKCKKNNIEHRLTKPATPKTNGMVERVNGTIKKNTILKKVYSSVEEMNTDLEKFLSFYNLYRRHGSLRKELNVKTPFQAIEKWFSLKPELFKKSPIHLKKKILNLNAIVNQLHQQPCET
ncbi:MAG: transposase [Saprospiraceae bacterium]|nr:transposase [Saprospiraceae bacterium]